MLFPFFQWCEASGFGQAVKTSPWAFAITESVHLLALAAIGGAVLVLDLRLPHAGGVELVRTIRKIDGGRLPILVFSGTIANAAEVKDLAGLGVAGYVNEYSAVQNILPSLAPHLFPDNFNRRGSPRVVLGIPVAYRFGNTIAAALTLNLSKGGVAIRTACGKITWRNAANGVSPSAAAA